MPISEKVQPCRLSLYVIRRIKWFYTNNASMPLHSNVQYIPRNMHTVFALLCFVVVIYWLIFPYPSGLLHWHCGNLTIAPVPAKQPWWIWINTSFEFIMNDCITTTKQSTTKPRAYFLGYTVYQRATSHDLVKETKVKIKSWFVWLVLLKFYCGVIGAKPMDSTKKWMSLLC